MQNFMGYMLVSSNWRFDRHLVKLLCLCASPQKVLLVFLLFLSDSCSLSRLRCMTMFKYDCFTYCELWVLDIFFFMTQALSHENIATKSAFHPLLAVIKLCFSAQSRALVPRMCLSTSPLLFSQSNSAFVCKVIPR